jgi:hypothetical protein
MPTYHTRDGRQVAASEAIDERGSVRDGYSVRSKLMIMDGAIINVDEQTMLTDQQRSDEIGERNRRLCDAWRNPPPLQTDASVRDAALAAIADVYDRHDKRLENAWR